MLDKDGTDAQEQFIARVYEKLGSQVLQRELEDIGLENTPQYDPYEDETQNEQTSPQLAEDLETMPGVGDYYIRAEILLSRVYKMAMGHVVVWCCNASGNIMGRAHTNPILDTRMYQVEVTWRKVTEFTTNAIAESMYTQCDAGGNDYLLLDSLVDSHKDKKVIYLAKQQTTIQAYQ